MKLELDKRIPNQNCIFTCFDTECAEQYVGKQGYFTNCYTLFANINSLVKGTLTKICDSSVNEKYYTNVGEKYYSFFLPEDLLKPEEKKYKPFTSAAFEKYYDVGSVIIYRDKKEKHCTYKAIVTSTIRDYMENAFYVVIRGYTYTLDELFKKYEIYEFGEWKPFGVKE